MLHGLICLLREIKSSQTVTCSKSQKLKDVENIIIDKALESNVELILSVAKQLKGETDSLIGDSPNTFESIINWTSKYTEKQIYDSFRFYYSENEESLGKLKDLYQADYPTNVRAALAKLISEVGNSSIDSLSDTERNLLVDSEYSVRRHLESIHGQIRSDLRNTDTLLSVYKFEVIHRPVYKL